MSPISDSSRPHMNHYNHYLPFTAGATDLRTVCEPLTYTCRDIYTFFFRFKRPKVPLMEL